MAEVAPDHYFRAIGIRTAKVLADKLPARLRVSFKLTIFFRFFQLK